MKRTTKATRPTSQPAPPSDPVPAKVDWSPLALVSIHDIDMENEELYLRSKLAFVKFAFASRRSSDTLVIDAEAAFGLELILDSAAEHMKDAMESVREAWDRGHAAAVDFGQQVHSVTEDLKKIVEQQDGDA